MSTLLFRTAVLAAAIALTFTAHAQPALDSLWPNADQKTWQYDYSYELLGSPLFTGSATLHFNGTVEHFGNTLQVLEARDGQEGLAKADAGGQA